MDPITSQTPTVQLGLRLRQARLARNLTQSAVADGLFSVSYISAVERGQIRPSLGALEKLAERLQVPVPDLLQAGAAGASGASGAGAMLPRAEFFPTGEREEIDGELRSAQILLHQGQPHQAVKLLEKLQQTPRLSAREQALVGWRRAQCAIALQQGEQACSEAQEARALAERLGDPELRERVRLTLAHGLALVGQHQAALDQLRLVREAIDTGVVRDPLFQLEVLSLLGGTQWQLGDSAGAITTLSQAAAIANEVLLPERLGARYAQLAEESRAAGDARRTWLYETYSLAAYQDAATRRLALWGLTRLGRAYAQSGNLSEAMTLLEQARERAERQQDPRALAESLAVLAGISLREQHIEDAVRAAQQALAAAESVTDGVLQAEAQLVLAQILEAKSDDAGAERTYEEAINHLRAAADTGSASYPLSDAYAQYSAFLERHGHNQKALEILKQAWQLRER